MRVALTFDVEHPDRPTRERTTEAIVDALAAADVRATMFLQGRWVRAYPATARLIAESGHLVGNHSHFHARMPMLTGRALSSDVLSAARVILGTTGVDPRPWFRCPFGAGMDDPEVLHRLEGMGYVHVGWDVDPRDWHEDSDAEAVARGVLEGSRVRDDSIVLLHSWPDSTGAAVPRILAGLAEAGAELVTIETLMG